MLEYTKAGEMAIEQFYKLLEERDYFKSEFERLRKNALEADLYNQVLINRSDIEKLE